MPTMNFEDFLREIGLLPDKRKTELVCYAPDDFKDVMKTCNELKRKAQLLREEARARALLAWTKLRTQIDRSDDLEFDEASGTIMAKVDKVDKEEPSKPKGPTDGEE